MVQKDTSFNNPDNIFRTSDNLDEYIKGLDPNSYLARVALEYTVSNSKIELHEELIDCLLHSGNQESKEWAEVYKIDNLVSKQELSLPDSITQLTYILCSSKEMSVLQKIFQLYNYYDLKAFQMIEIVSELINKELKEIPDGYMKDSLQSRLDLAMQSVYTHLNELEKARIYGENLKDIALTPVMKAIAYKNLGMTYLYEDYDKLCTYFEMSLKIFKEMDNSDRLYNVQSKYNFAQTFWSYPDKTVWLRKETIDELQIYAYSLIKSGNKEEAHKILDSTKNSLSNDFQFGYHYYFLGLLNDNEKNYYESVKYFSKSGDRFFRQLPLIALKEKGVDTSLLSALSV
ncbi:AimR family lysis-lysogeny pheromone receptor [Evansella cellulosilytica]|nr:AimR family lysis-lysogeny pheromone receptor [Evansella cellulosilytica]